MKEKKVRKLSLVIEFLIWGSILGFGIVGIVFNFMNNKVFQGVLWSVLSLVALAGLIFNVVYILKHLGDNPNVPEE